MLLILNTYFISPNSPNKKTSRQGKLLFPLFLVATPSRMHAVLAGGGTGFGGLKVQLGQLVLDIVLVGHTRLVDPLHNDRGHTLVDHADGLGRGPRQVDDAPAAMGATVGHTDHDTLVRARIGHTEQGAEGMGTVGTGQAVVVQPLAATGACPGGPFGIKRSLTPLLLLGQQRSKAKSDCG